MVVVHPDMKSDKKAGLIVLTTKTLTPKSLTCSSHGKNFCFHLKVHKDILKKEAQEETDNTDSDEILLESNKNIIKVFQSKRLISTNNEIEAEVESTEDDAFNPFKFSSAAANFFNVNINFLPTLTSSKKTRKLRIED